MAYDRFLIAPLATGLQTDLKPWLIPDDAFEELNNAYIFRGRLRKRFGSTYTGTGWPSEEFASLYSRLSIPLTGGAAVGITDGTGAATGTVPGAIFKAGQLFTIGETIYTVQSVGSPVAMLMTDATTTATYDTANGSYIFAGAPINSQIYFYPAEPVMGMVNYLFGALNNQPTYIFDTQFVYKLTSGFWQRHGSTVWHGTDSDFFYSCNWSGITANLVAIFTSNFFAVKEGPVGATDDPIYSFNGTTWSAYSPKFLTAGAGNIIKAARIIIPFQNRLVMLNTIESDAANAINSNFVNRCRYSINGSPFPDTTSWLEPNQVGASGAGFIDAPTEEAIISAATIKNRLIVYFERSTWELAYTGNQVLPFIWQQINDGLGCESTFSAVQFDKTILTVGTTGIIACTGANVQRIDEKIPDQVFEMRNKNEGLERVSGIRDYYTEMVYWTFPLDSAPSTSDTFPNKVLVYNYKNDTWGFNDDCITTFGYFEQQVDLTWANTVSTWQTSNFIWTSGIVQSNFRQVIAGNQQGYVFNIVADISRNAGVMQISDMIQNGTDVTLTIIDHTLSANEYVAIEWATGIVLLDESGDPVDKGIYLVTSVADANTINVGPLTFTGTYTGGGTVARVSNYNIKSKQWNPYIKAGRDVFVAKIDFGVSKTSSGQVSIDYFPSSSNISMVAAAQATVSSLGNNVLETSPYVNATLENYQTRLWHPVYFQSEGQCIQIVISMNHEQITNTDIAWENFELQGMILYCMPTSNRLY